MAIEVKLEAEGTPGGNSEITQPEALINEVEVIMQTLPTVRFQEGLAGFLVMPGLIRRAGFHGREDMHEPRVGAAMPENGLDPIFLPKAFQFADKLDLKTVLLGQGVDVGPDGVPQGFGKPGIIENPDATEMEEGCHASGITEPWQCALDDDSVKTRQHSANLFLVAVKQ